MSRNMSRSQHMTMRNGRFNTTRSGAGFDSRGGQGLLDIDAVLFNQRRRDFHYGIDNSDIDIDNLQHQLQQQLSLRESQLALANSLLQRQSHMLEEMSMGAHGDMLVGGRMSDFGMYGEMVNKRRPETRLGFFDFQPENKRFRQDIHSLPHNRDRLRTNEHVSIIGNRRLSSQKNQTSSTSSKLPSGRTNRQDDSATRRNSSNLEDHENKKISVQETEKTVIGDDRDITKDPSSSAKVHKYFCHVCSIDCQNESDFNKHMNGTKHKKRLADVLSKHQVKSSQIMAQLKSGETTDKKSGKTFCKICDKVLDTLYANHLRQTLHKKRVLQVTRGCGWCGIEKFSNFTEVLTHRETSEHKKNQALFSKTSDKDSKDSGSESSFQKIPKLTEDSKDANVKVVLPLKLSKYDPEVAVGQNCIVPVTGFFCQLCNKFYSNEQIAKETHCKSEGHFNLYKKFLYDKLKEKALAKQEAVRKLAAESLQNSVAEECEDKEERENSSGSEEDDMEDTNQEEEESKENTEWEEEEKSNEDSGEEEEDWNKEGRRQEGNAKEGPETMETEDKEDNLNLAMSNLCRTVDQMADGEGKAVVPFYTSTSVGAQGTGVSEVMTPSVLGTAVSLETDG